MSQAPAAYARTQKEAFKEPTSFLLFLVLF